MPELSKRINTDILTSMRNSSCPSMRSPNQIPSRSRRKSMCHKKVARGKMKLAIGSDQTLQPESALTRCILPSSRAHHIETEAGTVGHKTSLLLNQFAIIQLQTANMPPKQENT